MKQEILKNSFPAPDWFIKELAKELKTIRQLMEKEKVPERLIKFLEKQEHLDDNEQRIAIEELRIENRKNSIQF